MRPVDCAWLPALDAARRMASMTPFRFCGPPWCAAAALPGLPRLAGVAVACLPALWALPAVGVGDGTSGVLLLVCLWAI